MRRWVAPRTLVPGFLAIVAVTSIGLAAFTDVLSRDDRDVPPGTPPPILVELARDREDRAERPAATRPLISLPEPLAALQASYALFEASDATRHYAAALAARDAGEHEFAQAYFTLVIESGSVLAPVAELRLAQSLASSDERAAAAEIFARVIEVDALPRSLHLAALTDAATNLVRLDRGADAIPLLEAISGASGISAFQRANALWRAAQIRRDLNDVTWVATATDVMRLAPASVAAIEALDTLDAAGIGVPHMTAAQVHYRFRRNADAAQLYEEAIESGTLTAAEEAIAWFYLGALAERFNEPEEAIEAYGHSLALDPAGSLADDALYWRGRVFEELGEPASAALQYDELVTRFPGSSFASDARLRGALGLGLSGDLDAAMLRLETIAATSAPTAASEAARWHTVFRETFGAHTEADLDPRAYHPAALWSQLGAVADPLPADAYEEAPPRFAPMRAAERDEIESWLLATFGPREQPATAILDDPLTVLGVALYHAGERAVGRSLLAQVASQRQEQPYELLDLAIAARHAGIHDVAMNAANRILARISVWDRLDAPLPLLRIAYPAPYTDELAAAIEHSPVPPLLLLALVRQESAFNPEAVSSAGATGLAQVMPATGEWIAQSLGEPWSLQALRDPATSLRYGAYYIALQLDTFDGQLLAALAAYNGGGGNAARWQRNQPFPGPDGYVYGVDFSETRLYFQHVLENYAWYRYIYADADQPAIR
jgi:soluble lytic murein transglycosylase